MIKILIFSVIIFFGTLAKIIHSFFFSASAIRRKVNKGIPKRVIDIEPPQNILLEGAVVTEQHIKTILNNEKCVWYKLEVFCLRTASWEIEADAREMINFELRDHTGSAYVKAQNLEVAVKDTTYEKEKITKEEYERIFKFLKDKNRITPILMGNNYRIKLKETWIPLNSKVRILGKGYAENGRKGLKSDMIKPMYLSIQ